MARYKSSQILFNKDDYRNRVKVSADTAATETY